MIKTGHKSLESKLIGFDARKLWLDSNSVWGRERRTHFLLRMDANPILSTDELVWPSVFRTHQLRLESETKLEALGLMGPQRPGWVGPNLPLWEDLDRLKSYLLTENLEVGRPYWIIAVTVYVHSEIVASLPFGPYFGETKPDRLDLSWDFLGYDVSDGSLLSGLTNCGYPQDERESPLRINLEKELNRFHLFKRIEAAETFKNDIDKRVKEHAPFLIYGLYLVEKIED